MRQISLGVMIRHPNKYTDRQTGSFWKLLLILVFWFAERENCVFTFFWRIVYHLNIFSQMYIYFSRMYWMIVFGGFLFISYLLMKKKLLKNRLRTVLRFSGRRRNVILRGGRIWLFSGKTKMTERKDLRSCKYRSYLTDVWT